MSYFTEKYRPQNINDIWGNEHIKLIYQGLVNKPPHSILLTGVYGTGKTTIARMIGKQLAPEIDPSFFCLAYEAFYDMDSTKHNTETVKTIITLIATLHHEKIVLFFDETHQMSESAQSQFLKISEDDSKLLLIFSTTEPKNIIGGIRSRSMPINLQKPSMIEIVPHLSTIAKNENMKITDNALELIVRISQFVPRDCLVNLEKLSYCDKLIDENIVREILA